MLRRLYVDPAYRDGALLPLFRKMRDHVIGHQFERLQFIARKKMTDVFETYKAIAEHLKMERSNLDEGSILYSWDLPKSKEGALGKLFKL